MQLPRKTNRGWFQKVLIYLVEYTHVKCQTSPLSRYTHEYLQNLIHIDRWSKKAKVNLSPSQSSKPGSWFSRHAPGIWCTSLILQISLNVKLHNIAMLMWPVGHKNGQLHSWKEEVLWSFIHVIFIYMCKFQMMQTDSKNRSHWKVPHWIASIKDSTGLLWHYTF